MVTTNPPSETVLRIARFALTSLGFILISTSAIFVSSSILRVPFLYLGNIFTLLSILIIYVSFGFFSTLLSYVLSILMYLLMSPKYPSPLNLVAFLLSFLFAGGAIGSIKNDLPRSRRLDKSNELIAAAFRVSVWIFSTVTVVVGIADKVKVYDPIFLICLGVSIYGLFKFLRSKSHFGFTALWMEANPLDVLAIRHLIDRSVGIGISIIIYAYVIFSFSGLYYYMDTCDTRWISCDVLNGLNRPRVDLCEETTTNANFSGIQTKRCGADPTFSLNDFLPYLYFSVVTSTTVGYGDIFPQSAAARWIVIVHHIVAVILLVGVAGQMAGLSVNSRNTGAATVTPSGPSRCDQDGPRIP
jgi:hypothetical protein